MIDIEKLENLPYRESNKHHKWKHNYKDDECHKVGDYYPYTIAQRIITKYLGRTFEEAFSHYCRLVPKYQQKYFLKEFAPEWGYANYYIDEFGKIQEYMITKPKKSICINKIPNLYLEKAYRYPWSWERTTWKIIQAYPNRYDNSYPAGEYWHKQYFILIKDNAEYFESKQDRRFKRYYSEKRRQKILNSRRSKKIPILTELEFRRILREKVLREKEETRIKLEAKGMRPDAFTNHI